MVYLGLLAWLLLSATPADVARSRVVLGDLWLGICPFAHFGSFFLLTVLALSARWPVPRWAIGLTLLAAAIGTELAQVSVPRRSPDLADAACNLAGVAVAAAVCWLAVRTASRERRTSVATSV